MVGPKNIVHVSSQLHNVQEEYDPKETKMCKTFFLKVRDQVFVDHQQNTTSVVPELYQHRLQQYSIFKACKKM